MGKGLEESEDRCKSLIFDRAKAIRSTFLE
jgi:hypothetical protein